MKKTKKLHSAKLNLEICILEIAEDILSTIAPKDCLRSNQQKAALEQQKAAMEHDLEAGSFHSGTGRGALKDTSHFSVLLMSRIRCHYRFYFSYLLILKLLFSTFSSFQVAWELVSELRHCLVDKMQQEDLQATPRRRPSHPLHFPSLTKQKHDMVYVAPARRRRRTRLPFVKRSTGKRCTNCLGFGQC